MRQLRSDERPAELAERQAALVAALASPGVVPEGFDSQRMANAAAALRDKRRRALAKSWPGLAAALGTAFGATFDDFMRTHRWPGQQPLDDAVAFARWLSARNLLPQSCRLELLGIELGHCPTPFGLRPRRGWAFRVRILRSPWVIAWGVYVPRYGVRSGILWPLPSVRRQALELG